MIHTTRYFVSLRSQLWRVLRTVGTAVIMVTVVGACGPKKPAAKSESVAAVPSMADMPGMKDMPNMKDVPGMNQTSADSALLTPNSVTLSAVQLKNGVVRWESANEQSIAGSVELPGRITTNEDHSRRLGALTEGRVLTVHVSPGEHIAVGDRLVTMQSQQAAMVLSDKSKGEAEVNSRKAAAAYARSARDRAERLLALKAIPRQDVERAVADDELAQAALAQAQAELARVKSVIAQLGVEGVAGRIVIRAPIAGVVTSRDVMPGAVVMAGPPLLTIADPTQLWLSVSVPEVEASTMRVGMRLRFVVGAAARDTFDARIQSVSGTFDSLTRALPVRAVVADTRGILRPEMFAKVWLVQANQRAITVPDSAVQRLGNGLVVFIARPNANGGSTFTSRSVEIGATQHNRTAIVRGLAVGDLIVVTGAFAVKSQLLRSSMPKMEM